jgi:hypothetical protein
MGGTKELLFSKQQAAIFADKWKNFTDEKQHCRGFWSEFFRTLCGVEDEEAAGIEYEKKVKSSLSGNQGYIDVYWKNVVLIEHKSTGENLDKAEIQARGYMKSLPPGYRPRMIIISDFANFVIIDQKLNRTKRFSLAELPKNIHRFEFITEGSKSQAIDEEITVDQVAAKLMANLYLTIEEHGFEGHETSVFLNRILFLMFGDDTGMWGKNLVKELILKSKEDGSDLGQMLGGLFEVLNTAEDKREKNLDQKFAKFPYINGGIFSEKISEIEFSGKMRAALIDVANYDWATINPTIFGALFQLIKSKEKRRELGEHYTSEENINKVIYPLFLDDLQNRLERAWDNKKALKELRVQLGKYKLFDPACGCGNFLIVAYRHLRQLELEIIVRLGALEGTEDKMQLDGSMGLSVSIRNLYGIEIEEWPAQVARVAIFLTDHQENQKLERVTGTIYNYFPLSGSANITNGNALTLAWDDVVKFDDSLYVLSNPPFLGHISRSIEQTQELINVWGREDIGRLDYVTAWYKKAIDAFRNVKNPHFAFVSTNSISQGEPVPSLFGPIFSSGWRISFAHRTFVWSSDTPGMANVHCVIIGCDKNIGPARLFTYFSNKSEPIESEVQNINGYLADGPNVLVEQSRNVLGVGLPQVSMGSMPRDGGHLLIDTIDEYEKVMADPSAAKYVRRYIMGNELINNIPRWCLWLVDLDTKDINRSPELRRRLKAVAENRLKSNAESTRQMAETPHLFGQRSQSLTPYLGIPSVFSDSRKWATVALLGPDVIAGNKIYKCDDPDGYAFAIASSSMFITWQKTVGGRLKSDPNFSNTLVWNNLPLPGISEDLKREIIAAGINILNVRDLWPETSLADMYNPLGMKKELLSAHRLLDVAVDKAFGATKPLTDNVQREGLLFQQYLNLTGTLNL